MTVSTEVDHNDYTGNGVTTSFPYTFRIFKKSDLTVQVADLNENITVLTLDTDYSVTGAGTYSGGNVVLMSPLANGWQISISRDLPVTQETDLRNQGKFFAEVHEDAFDKLTMLIQQCFSFLRLALRKPSFIANYYDALNNRIRNLRDPSQAQDAATKKYVDDGNAGSNSYADSLFRRTLRVPEDYIDIMPSVNGRRGKLLAFDSLGRPISIHSETDDGTQLEIDMAGPDGLKYIGQCPDINTLRQIEFSVTGQQIFLKEHTAGQSAGGGIWYCHSLTSDSSYVDDNGCQIINNYGQVIRRKDIKELTSSYFGLRAGDTIDPVLTNMYKASRTFNIYEAKIENPGFDKGYVVQGGLRFYCGDKPFYILSYSIETLRGPNLYHTGNNIAFTFSRFKEDGTSQQAWSGGGIRGFRFWGASSYLVQGNSGTDATPVRVSDMWNGEASDLWITGYTGNTNGGSVSLYNEFAWTEGARVENVMVRQSLRGITFLRKHGTTATDSFFRPVIDMSFNAGVSGQSTQEMVVGDGTLEGQCVVYGHDIKLTQWMSAGAWHDIVRLEDYSIISETGVIKIVADGYGISKSTVPATEVVHAINVRGLNARFRSRVENWSNQAGGWGLDFLNIIFQSSMYTNAMTFYESDFDALPTINPVGMKVRFNGTFTVDERLSGKVYTLNRLIPGMTLKVKLTSRNGNDLNDAVVQEWKVFVRSTNLPCIVVPMSGSANIATTDGLALVTTAGATATFLKTVTPTQARNFIGQNYGLTVKNANDDNSLSYAVNSGRKIRFVLPANPTATTTTPYSVEIEVL
ncbi:TPA: phage tail fiber protein [Klebsiella pneumoniae]|uniref:phage tail fiber protein n=1 Tax=Klebsiella pneumoniae TaxID=573 RepID=UPI0026F06E74|nr:phage tail fiber protein [Klebsiella pneumoniae]MDO7168483.1 phage tail fiber protein [Klebsiella pneumoniae]